MGDPSRALDTKIEATIEEFLHNQIDSFCRAQFTKKLVGHVELAFGRLGMEPIPLGFVRKVHIRTYVRKARKRGPSFVPYKWRKA